MALAFTLDLVLVPYDHHAASAGGDVFRIVANGIVFQIVGVSVQVQMHPRVADDRLKILHVDFVCFVVSQHEHPFVVGINGIQRGAEPRELRTAVLLHDVFMEPAWVWNGFAGGVLNAARIPFRAVIASVIRHARVGVQCDDVQNEDAVAAVA